MMSLASSILSPLVIHPLVAQTTTPALPSPHSERSAAVWMFILIASLLLFFIIIIMIGLTARMVRRAKASNTSDNTNTSPTENHQPDPWQEAGKRLNNQSDDIP